MSSSPEYMSTATALPMSDGFMAPEHFALTSYSAEDFSFSGAHSMKKPAKRHLSLRLTSDEVVELLVLRQVVERMKRKAVTLQACVRVAISAAHDAGNAASLDFARLGTDRDERMELIVDAEVGRAVDALQAAHQDESHSSIVLACARLVTMGASNAGFLSGGKHG